MNRNKIESIAADRTSQIIQLAEAKDLFLSAPLITSPCNPITVYSTFQVTLIRGFCATREGWKYSKMARFVAEKRIQNGNRGNRKLIHACFTRVFDLWILVQGMFFRN